MAEFGMRIGHGFDVHRFAQSWDPQKPLVLAGCRLPDELTLEAHSDGDVVLHALCDALLGAAGLGDIGEHFPDTDASYADADSGELLQKVLEHLRQRGFTPVNVDITVVAQLPRLSPHRRAMRERLTALCNLATDCVNLKATTTERLGYIGREEGIACHAVALIAKQG